MRDKLFDKPDRAVTDFDFGEKTAEVFDDMLDRSIPLYSELQRMIGELANEFAVSGTNVYDLGCSTGITLQSLMGAIKKDVTFVGVDYSAPMLERAERRLESLDDTRPHRTVCADLNGDCDIKNASVIVLNLTLQFVRPLFRDLVLRRIHAGLNENGCLILVEKVLGNDSMFNRMFINNYYEMKKRNGYSETEIAKKREALENVLIPYRVDENLALLRSNGFSHTDMFYKWYNFAGFLAVK